MGQQGGKDFFVNGFRLEGAVHEEQDVDPGLLRYPLDVLDDLLPRDVRDVLTDMGKDMSVQRTPQPLLGDGGDYVP